MIRSILVVAVLAVATCVPSAGAQSIFKYVRPDGSVVYTDRTVPGARLEEELEPPPPPSPAQVEAARAQRNALERAADQRSQSLDQAREEIRQWTPKLADAKAQLEAGREPRAGERIGTYQDKSRMNDVYWARQKANADAVTAAEARIKQAQDVVNANR